MILLAATLWFAGTSLVAWLFFWRDKRLTLAGKRRIPEAKLLHIAMIGG